MVFISLKHLYLEALSQRNQGLDKRRNILDKNIKALQASRLEKEIGVNWEKIFEKTLERIKQSSAELPFKEKQQLIRLIVEKIVVSKDEIKIMHCISPKNFQENLQLCCDDLMLHAGLPTFIAPRYREKQLRNFYHIQNLHENIFVRENCFRKAVNLTAGCICSKNRFNGQSPVIGVEKV